MIDAPHSRLGVWLALGIPAIGIPTVLLVRLLAWWHQPQLFSGTLPSISKTAAFAPGSWVFAAGMTLVALCIIFAWPVAHALNRRAIERIAGDGGPRRQLDRLNGASALAGTTAGGALGALALVTLETHDGLHVLLSKVFFGAQVFALICDSLLARRLRKLSRPAAMPAGTGARFPICVAVLLLAAFFLFMFLAKDSGLIPDRMLVRWLYVGSENLLCALLLLYSLTYVPSLRQERPMRGGLIDLGHEASRRLGRG